MLVTAEAEAGTLLSLVMDVAPLELNTFLRLIFRFQEKYCLYKCCMDKCPKDTSHIVPTRTSKRSKI